MNYLLAALVAGSILWLLSASQVQAPQPPKVVVEVRQASMVVSCGERQEICRLRSRMEKVKERAKKEIDRGQR